MPPKAPRRTSSATPQSKPRAAPKSKPAPSSKGKTRALPSSAESSSSLPTTQKTPGALDDDAYFPDADEEYEGDFLDSDCDFDDLDDLDDLDGLLLGGDPDGEEGEVLVDDGPLGDVSANESFTGHDDCDGQHICEGRDHEHLVEVSRHPPPESLDASVPCEWWWGTCCRICYHFDYVQRAFGGNGRVASVKSWTATDAKVAARLGHPPPPSADITVFETLTDRGVKTISLAMRTQSLVHLTVSLEDYTMTGRDHGDETYTSIPDLYQDTIPGDLATPLPAPLTRFMDFAAQRTAMRESIDLRFQVFEVDGTPSLFPYHHPSNLQKTTWLFNHAKAGGITEVPRLFTAALHARNAGPEFQHLLAPIHTAIVALGQLHAAHNSQRLASDELKRDVITMSQKVTDAFEKPDSVVHLDLAASAAANARTLPSVSAALKMYQKRFRRPDEDSFLAPFITKEVKADFVKFVRELSQLLHFEFKINSRGFPLGPFGANDSEGAEDSLLRFCCRAETEFEEMCDEENEDDPNASPYAVLLLVLLNEALHDGCDPLTGLPIDWTFEAWSPLRPTVVAHTSHGRAGRYGLKTKFPSSISDWDPRSMSVRLEAWGTNKMIASNRYSALLRYAVDSVDDANAVLLVLHHQRLLDLPVTLPPFKPDANFRSLLYHNGLAPFEAQLLFKPSGAPVEGKVAATEYMLPALIDAAAELGLSIPNRDNTVLSMADITMSSRRVQTTGKIGGGARRSSKKGGTFLRYDAEVFIESMTRHSVLKGGNSPTPDARVADWAPIAIDVGLDPTHPSQTFSQWKKLRLYYHTALHLITHYNFSWDPSLCRPVAPPSVWKAAAENNAQPVALYTARFMYMPFGASLAKFFGHEWPPTSSGYASPPSAPSKTTDLPTLALASVQNVRQAHVIARRKHDPTSPEGWTPAQQRTLVQTVGDTLKTSTKALNVAGEWERISEQVGQPSAACDKEWRRLRDDAMQIQKAQFMSPGLSWDSTQARLVGSTEDWDVLPSNQYKNVGRHKSPLYPQVRDAMSPATATSTAGPAPASTSTAAAQAVQNFSQLRINNKAVWTSEDAAAGWHKLSEILGPNRTGLTRDGPHWDDLAAFLNERRQVGGEKTHTNVKSQFIGRMSGYLAARQLLALPEVRWEGEHLTTATGDRGLAAAFKKTKPEPLSDSKQRLVKKIHKLEYFAIADFLFEPFTHAVQNRERGDSIASAQSSAGSSSSSALPSGGPSSSSTSPSASSGAASLASTPSPSVSRRTWTDPERLQLIAHVGTFLLPGGKKLPPGCWHPDAIKPIFGARPSSNVSTEWGNLLQAWTDLKALLVRPGFSLGQPGQQAVIATGKSWEKVMNDTSARKYRAIKRTTRTVFDAMSSLNPTGLEQRNPRPKSATLPVKTKQPKRKEILGKAETSTAKQRNKGGSGSADKKQFPTNIQGVSDKQPVAGPSRRSSTSAPDPSGGKPSKRKAEVQEPEENKKPRQ